MSRPHVMIVEARYHAEISDNLARGAIAVLDQAGATYERFIVPGALEIPAAIAIAAQTKKFDAYIALGCVIRTQTYHFEVVCNETVRGLGEISITKNLAIGNGILTVENYDQAIERADPAKMNRGADAAQAALAVLDIKQRLGAGV
ncbi:MAG: 6,7-dimethyl-8-ribityllumazine synthase [Alphaproteobacteria bacterium]